MRVINELSLERTNDNADWIKKIKKEPQYRGVWQDHPKSMDGGVCGGDGLLPFGERFWPWSVSFWSFPVNGWLIFSSRSRPSTGPWARPWMGGDALRVNRRVNLVWSTSVKGGFKASLPKVWTSSKTKTTFLLKCYKVGGCKSNTLTADLHFGEAKLLKTVFSKFLW